MKEIVIEAIRRHYAEYAVALLSIVLVTYSYPEDRSAKGAFVFYGVFFIFFPIAVIRSALTVRNKIREISEAGK